jgi:integrase
VGETQHEVLEGHGRAPLLTPSVSGTEASLRRQLVAAWDEIKDLRRTVAHQARLLENLSSETHPAAPSLNCVYWLFSLSHEHESSWKERRNRILPSLRGLGTMLAPDVTPVVWARHLASRIAEGNACAHTRNIELGRLKGMLNWAVDNEMIQVNPLRSVKKEKTVSRRETELRYYDVDNLLAAAEDVTDRRLCDGDDDGLRAKKLRAFVLCCFDSMLRFKEAHRLDRDAISPDGDVTVLGKGNKLRTVRLTSRTLEAIREIPGKGRIFPESPATYRRHFRWACEHGRIDAKAAPRDRRIVIHHLRHAGATEADAAGVRPGALQVVLGHASMATTERFYLHRDKDAAAREVASAMERVPPRRVPKKKK